MCSGPLTLAWEKGLDEAGPWLSDPHHSLEHGLGIQKQSLLGSFPSASLAIPRRLWGQLAAGCSRGNNSSLHPSSQGKPPTSRGDMTEEKCLTRDPASHKLFHRHFMGSGGNWYSKQARSRLLQVRFPTPFPNPITSH